DTLAPGRAGDDAGIGIEPLVLLGPEEERLVDAVLALDGEGAQLAEAELAIQGLGLAIVVQYRQVEVTAAAAHEILHQMAYQHLAHAEPLGLAVGRQAPEAGALVRIIVGPGMVEPHHGAYDLTGQGLQPLDRKSTRLNSSHVKTSYAVFCLKKKKLKKQPIN